MAATEEMVSSRFSASSKWGNFASVGAAWNIANEAFFGKLTHLIPSLKLRASYGSNGNAEIGNYTWRQTFGYGYNYNGIAGGQFNNIGNGELTWEKNRQTDVGIDVGLFKNRLNITADYYKKVTKDALLTQNISRTSGFTGFINNLGDMENKGWELTINAFPVQTRDFTWEVNFNITHNVNQVTKLPAGDQYIRKAAIFISEKGSRSILSIPGPGLVWIRPMGRLHGMWTVPASRQPRQDPPRRFSSLENRPTRNTSEVSAIRSHIRASA